MIKVALCLMLIGLTVSCASHRPAPSPAGAAPAAPAASVPAATAPAAALALAEPAEVEWLTLEEALARHAEAPRKILIDMYTDWCGWCKRMDKDTYAQPEVAAYLNEHFYVVRFDAEGGAPVDFRGRTYTRPSGQRSHALAAALMQGRMSYPTTVFLNEDLDLLQPVPGYHKPKGFLKIASFFAEDHYQNTSWEQYQGRTAK